MADMKSFLAKVAAGQKLTREEAEGAFDIIMSGEATPSQIGGFLMALRVRGETVEEIAGAVCSMRAATEAESDERWLSSKRSPQRSSIRSRTAANEAR